MKFLSSLLSFSRHSLYERAMEKHHVGCLVEGDLLLSAVATITPSNVTVRLLDAASQESHVKPLDIAAQRCNCSPDHLFLAAAIPSHKTLLRTFDLAPQACKDLDAILNYQLEPHLPYTIEESHNAPLIVHTSKNNTVVSAFSTKKSEFEELLQGFRTLSIDPELIAPKALALTHFADVFLEKKEERILVDIGAEETTILFLKDNKPLAIRSLHMGLEGKEGEEDHLKTFSTELSRIFFSLASCSATFSSMPITFTGYAEQDPMILSILAQLLGHPMDTPTTLPPNVHLPESASLSTCLAFAVPLGLALIQSPLQKEKMLCNLRSGAFSYSNLWKRYRNDIIFFFGGVFLLSSVIMLFSSALIAHKTEPLRAQYQEYVALLNHTADDVEQAFAKTYSVPALPIDSLSADDINMRLSFIEEHIKKAPDTMALHPNVPRVADTLAWLNALPSSTTSAGSIAIERFEYVFVKCPDKERPTEHYQVRVDMHFTAPSPETARAFYDTLNSPNPFIDASKEVQWNMQKGIYDVSFFLKDRTLYP